MRSLDVMMRAVFIVMVTTDTEVAEALCRVWVAAYAGSMFWRIKALHLLGGSGNLKYRELTV